MMSLSCSFSTTKRVIDRVHSHTTDGGANTTPPAAASLSKFGVHTVFVSDDPNRRIALRVDPAELA